MWVSSVLIKAFLSKGALPQLQNVYLSGNPGNAELVQGVLRERTERK